MSQPVAEPTTTDTYGLPVAAAHLITKLRNMPDWLRDDVRGVDA